MTKPISLENLTPYQVEMLEIMWSLDSLEDFEAWQELLDAEDQQLCDVLVRLIIQETCEDLVSDVSQAREYLKKFQL